MVSFKPRFSKENKSIVIRYRNRSCGSENEISPHIAFFMEGNQKTKRHTLGVFQACLDKSMWRFFLKWGYPQIILKS